MNPAPAPTAAPPTAPPAPQAPPAANPRALHWIAAYEALKGLAALATLVGVLDLMHHDVRHLAVELIGRFGLNPQGHYPSLLLHYADLLPGAPVRTMVLLALGYVALRWAEAWGLWNDKAWGELLGALSGAIYLPFEAAHWWHRPSLISASVLLGNVLLVVYLVGVLLRRRKAHAAVQPGP